MYQIPENPTGKRSAPVCQPDHDHQLDVDQAHPLHRDDHTDPLVLLDVPKGLAEEDIGEEDKDSKVNSPPPSLLLALLPHLAGQVFVQTPGHNSVKYVPPKVEVIFASKPRLVK